ncbi:MAG: prohibitin family protein [Luteibaculaceae bacterium]
MYINFKWLGTFTVLALLFSSCAIVRQGDVGVKQRLGKIDEKTLGAGPKVFNPFITRIIRVPERTTNIEVKLDLPSKEGLNVGAEISILYRVEKSFATNIIGTIGADFEQVVILPVFRAAAADVSAKYMAKDMHSGNRFEIEQKIRDKMDNNLSGRGFVIEAVLLKSIRLPQGLSRAIEDKLEAEQEAERMQFVLQKERQEAERREIEAEGIKTANQIIAEGLTPAIIQFKAIEAYRELSRSNNAKIIIGNGNNPLLLNP